MHERIVIPANGPITIQVTHTGAELVLEIKPATGSAAMATPLPDPLPDTLPDLTERELAIAKAVLENHPNGIKGSLLVKVLKEEPTYVYKALGSRGRLSPWFRRGRSGYICKSEPDARQIRVILEAHDAI